MKSESYVKNPKGLYNLFINPNHSKGIKRKMTICIASLCENGKKIIISSDKMVTVGDVIEFEHDVTKFEELTKNSVVLTAGSATVYWDIVKMAKDKLGKLNNAGFEEILNLMKNSYKEFRTKVIEETYLNPIGLNFKSFYKSQRILVPEVVFRVMDTMEKHNVGVRFILCGFDNEGLGRIYTIDNPGISEPYNAVGFCTAGTGDLNAISIFTLHQYAPSFDLGKALYLTYAAKKNAERAPGVGNTTNIAIISKDGREDLSENQIKELDKIYYNHTKIDEDGYKEVNEKVLNGSNT